MSGPNIFIPNNQKKRIVVPPPNKNRLASIGDKITALASLIFLIGILFMIFAFWPDSIGTLVFDRMMAGVMLLSAAFLLGYIAWLFYSEVTVGLFPGLLLLIPLILWGWLSGFVNGDLFDSFWGDTTVNTSILFVTLLALVVSMPWFLRFSFRCSAVILSSLTLFSLLAVLHTVARLWIGSPWLSFGQFTVISESVIGSVNDAAVLGGALILLGITSLVVLPLRNYARIGIFAVSLLLLVLISFVNLASLWFALSVAAVVTSLYVFLRRWLLQRERVEAIPVVVKMIIAALAVIFLVGSWHTVELAERMQANSDIELGTVRPAFSSSIAVLSGVYGNDILFGIGPNRYADAWRQHKDDTINQGQFWNIDFSAGHNFMITFFTTYGLVGGLLLVIFHLYFLWFGISRLVSPGDTKIVVRFSFTAAFLVAAYFWLMTYTYSPSAFVLVLAAAATGMTFALSSRWYQAVAFQIPLVKNRIRGLLFLGVGLLLGIGLYQVNSSILAEYQDRFGDEFNPKTQNDEHVGQLADVYIAELNSLIVDADETAPEQGALLSASEIALETARNAVALDKTNPVHLERLATLYTTLGLIGVTGGYESALSTLEEVKVIDPLDPRHWVAEAKIQLALTDIEAAQKAIGAAVERKADYLPAIQLETELYVASNNVETGVQKVSDYVSLYPSNALRWYQLGLLQAAVGETDEAITSLLQAIKIDPLYADARYVLAAQYLAREEFALAESQLNLILETNLGNVTIEQAIEALEQGDSPVLPGILSTGLTVLQPVDSGSDTSVLSPEQLAE